MKLRRFEVSSIVQPVAQRDVGRDMRRIERDALAVLGLALVEISAFNGKLASRERPGSCIVRARRLVGRDRRSARDGPVKPAPLEQLANGGGHGVIDRYPFCNKLLYLFVELIYLFVKRMRWVKFEGRFKLLLGLVVALLLE